MQEWLWNIEFVGASEHVCKRLCMWMSDCIVSLMKWMALVDRETVHLFHITVSELDGLWAWVKAHHSGYALQETQDHKGLNGGKHPI